MILILHRSLVLYFSFLKVFQLKKKKKGNK